MAQHSMDTVSQLSATDISQVNVHTPPSALSANSPVQSANVQSVPNRSVILDAPPSYEEAVDKAYSNQAQSLPPENLTLAADKCVNSKSSSSSFNASKRSNNISDSSVGGRSNSSTPRSPSLKNGNLKKSRATSTTANEGSKTNSYNSPEASHLVSSTDSHGKQPQKIDRASLQLKLNENSVSTKPRLVVKTLHENPIHAENSQETDLLLGNGSTALISPGKPECNKKYSSKSESDDEDRPVLHVQFHSEQSGSSSTVPVKDPCSTPSSSISSSSSSSSSSSESIDISEARPPDGGWGWVIVAVSFVVNLIADGITFSFGVMFHELLEYFGKDKSTTAWIGSLFMAMPLLSGPIASFLTDRYGCRAVTIAGSLLASTGFVISFFVDSMEVLYVTFGILAGFGLSLCYVASVVIVAYYFDKKRSFATGLAVCGSGIGTFIFAPLIQLLLEEYGWKGTTLILAGFLLNLAVCGALMKDLPWTSYMNKSAAKQRKQKRNMKRKKNDSSADTFSVSNSTNTASNLQPITENNEKGECDDDKENDQDRLFSSLVNLPTYVRNGEKVPIEVLELLSTHKNVYNVLLQNYPSLLAPSRSFSDSGRLHKAHLATKAPPLPSPLAALATEDPPPPSTPPATTDAAYLWWLKRNEITPPRMNPHKKLPTAYLKDLRVHRLSLTYRGAMLNINRYRLRASSCPDIYRNSMTTIAKEKMQWYAGLWDFWDLLIDIIDFSHFTNPKYLLFAISNFLLYAWYDVEYMYLTDHAVRRGFSEKDASILISVIGIVNMFGEIILGWAGDRPWINAGILYAVCMCLCGAVTAIVPLLRSYDALCFVSGGFGFFIAANYSLTCIILVELITLERFTNAYGLLLLVQGVANLIGPPIAGKICDIIGTYDLSFYLAGLFIALSGLLLMILPATNRIKKCQTLQRQASANGSIKGDGVSKEPKCPNPVTSCIIGNVDKDHNVKENHV